MEGNPPSTSERKASEQHPEVKECLDAVDAVEEVVPKKIETVKPRITGKERVESAGNFRICLS